MADVIHDAISTAAVILGIFVALAAGGELVTATVSFPIEMRAREEDKHE